MFYPLNPLKTPQKSLQNTPKHPPKYPQTQKNRLMKLRSHLFNRYLGLMRTLTGRRPLLGSDTKQSMLHNKIQAQTRNVRKLPERDKKDPTCVALYGRRLDLCRLRAGGHRLDVSLCVFHTLF